MLPRSEIQNVSYRLRQQQLERLSFDQQDPLTGEPTVDVLQEASRRFACAFTPTAAGRSAGTARRAAAGAGSHPDAGRHGEITRLFLITPGGSQ
jgi:general secretion pathway protein J